MSDEWEIEVCGLCGAITADGVCDDDCLSSGPVDVLVVTKERATNAEADAARWKAEAERLREDMKHALMVADETASMQCECDGYYRCGSCPTRIADRAEDAAEILKRSLDNDWGSALSAGGGTDA